MGGGSGRSTAPHVPPPSDEKYPRMGRRNISLEPTTICDGFDGFTAIEVSLWGPDSLETSTLAPTFALVVVFAAGLTPDAASRWYLAHHVGCVYEEPFAAPAA